MYVDEYRLSQTVAANSGVEPQRLAYRLQLKDKTVQDSGQCRKTDVLFLKDHLLGACFGKTVSRVVADSSEVRAVASNKKTALLLRSFGYYFLGGLKTSLSK